MDKNKPWKIVFMGTPDFAVPPLRALHESEHDVVLVVTQPDRPKGRGRKVIPTPVKAAAESFGYDVLQPVSIKTSEFFRQMKTVRPDLFVVAAFGHVMPEPILRIPPLGAINIHASLLPKYRGAAPIQWAVINREKQTGITTMQMDSCVDTGDILLREIIRINKDDTAGSLHDRLALVGATALMKTLDAIRQGNLEAIPQDDAIACQAPLLKKGDGRIDWNTPAGHIEAFIRGMTPWPGAFTFHGDKRLKIYKARPECESTGQPPGTVLDGFPDELRVATADAALSILEIQGASGKRLAVDAFLRGHPMPPGTMLN